jgi:hypothetical protein
MADDSQRLHEHPWAATEVQVNMLYLHVENSFLPFLLAVRPKWTLTTRTFDFRLANYSRSPFRAFVEVYCAGIDFAMIPLQHKGLYRNVGARIGSHHGLKRSSTE